ncbi:LuxR C-terminal-related transcriptional regulator, partial [Streptomyces sp. NPDC054847]
PTETDLPLGVAGQLLTGAGPHDPGPGAGDTELPGTAPGPAASGADASRLLHHRLRELAARQPLVALVDDAQHMDEASARALLYLCGRLTASRILLVLAGPHPARPAPLPPPLAELLRHPHCTPVTLDVFDEAAVAAYLATHLPGPPAAPLPADQWHRFSGGNPRLLAALAEDHRACGPVRSARPVAGTAFRAAVVACLRSAGPLTQATARALAVLADTATLTALARLLGVPERAVGPHLAELDATGLLAAGRLRHAGVRAAVLEDLNAQDAAGLHLRAAALLHEDGAGPGEVARHLLAADAAGTPAPGPAWAAPLLTRAAQHAMTAGGPRQAAAYLRSAARRSGGGSRRDAHLLEMLARAEWESDPAAVTRHLDPLEQALTAGLLEGPHLLGAAGLLLWHGQTDTLARALARPAAGHAAREAAAALAFVRPGTAPALTRQDDPHPAAERALESIAYDHAPPTPVAAVLSALLHTAETGQPARWRTLLPGSGSSRRTPARQAVAQAAAAVVCARTGAYDSAAGHAATALALLPPPAWGTAIGIPLSAAVLAATRRGDLDEAARHLAVPVPEAMFTTRAGLHYLLARGHHQLAAGRPQAALGDFHACRDTLERWQLHPATTTLDWRTPAAEALAAGAGHHPRDGHPARTLTDAERRVAVLAARGSTNRAIAARLYVTPSTVEQHLTRIYRKLRVTSRADLAHVVPADPP